MQKGPSPKISGRVSRKINSQGPLAFVQVDNRAMHPNEAPLGRDRAPLCLSSSPAFVPHCSDVFLCLTWLPDTFWTEFTVDPTNSASTSDPWKLKAPTLVCTVPVCIYVCL